MKRFSSTVIGLLSAVTLALWADSALADRRVALVVGNSKYQKINKLENPVNDAPDIAEALRKVGFDVIVRTDADKGGFDRALSEFARKASGSDTALFYYAGHGIQYQKQNFLLPVDIEVEDYNDVEFSAISVNKVMDALSRSGGVKIVVLDACRDNPLDKRIASTTRGVDGATRGLARLDRTEGLVIAYATSPDQVAQDGSGRNSPFTESLVRRLEEPGLEIATLFRRVTQDVFERTSGRQRPEVSISLLNDYYLNLSDSDSLVWSRIRDASDPVEFKNFIQKYPASPFAREAQFRLELFDRIRRENEQRQVQDQQRVATLEERELRESLEKERAALATERLAFERREAERREAEKQAVEKREADRLAAERQETARRETERLTLAKRETERLEIERLAAEKRDAERLVVERRDAVRREVERLAYERRETERRDAERLAAEKRDAEKLSGEQRETARLDAERLAAEKKIEAARLAREQQENGKRETERLAAEKLENQKIAALENVEARREAERALAEKREAEKLAAARRDAARKEAERLVAEKKSEAEKLALEQQEAKRRETERLAAEKKAEQERVRVAALQDADLKKQQAEAEKQRAAALCVREGDDVKRLVSAGGKDALEAFRKQAACPGTTAALDKAIKDITLAAVRACDADNKALGKAGQKDIAALRSALGSMTCGKVRADASGRIAKLEGDARKLELACAAESEKVTLAKSAGNEALTQLGALQKTLTCDSLRPVVGDAIKELAALAPKAAEIDTRRQILEAQTELKRLGCYSGNLNGNLNNGTKNAVGAFFKIKNTAAREISFSDDFVGELKLENAGLCPVVEPAAPIAKRPAREEADDDAPVVRRRPQRQDREEPVAERPAKRKPAVAAAPKPERQPVARAERPAAPRPAPAPVAQRAPAPVAAAPRASIHIIGVGF